MLARYVGLAYGLACYMIFLGTFLYAIGFVGNVVVPKSIDSPRDGSLAVALLVDMALLGVFAVQHSVMARRGFKQWWTQYVPKPLERSTYVLFASVALILLFALWRPLGGVIWDVTNPVLWGVLVGLCAFGWALVLLCTFLINHFDLFGLRQAYFYFRGKEWTPLKFATPGPYRHVRHPLYLGFLLAFWATPTMSAAHLFYAAMTTAYILIAIRLEERDLMADHGETYAEYRRRVPMIIPAVKGETVTPSETMPDRA